MSIALVAGLGNPGREYAPTRHNLGWIVLEALARKHGLVWRPQPSFDAEVARWDLAPGRTCWQVRPGAIRRDRSEGVELENGGRAEHLTGLQLG